MWKPKVIELDIKKSIVFGLSMVILADSARTDYSEMSFTTQLKMSVLFLGFIILLCCLINHYSNKLIKKLNKER